LPPASRWRLFFHWKNCRVNPLRALAPFFAAALGIAAPTFAYCQTIQLGEINKLGMLDVGGAGLLIGMGPYGLLQPATIQSLSFYVLHAAGKLRLGLYTAGVNKDCRGGALKAQTNAFTAIANSWNTAPVTAQVQLPVGYYCLMYEYDNNNLTRRIGVSSGVNDAWYGQSFGQMPSTFSTSAGGYDGNHWSFYATLVPTTPPPPPPPTLKIAFNPPDPSIPANVAPGTVVAAIEVAWSNGQPFTGTVAFGAPNFSDGGTFAIDGNMNVVVASGGGGVSGEGGTIQNVTVVATQ
jgi:hypothetical protein